MVWRCDCVEEVWRCGGVEVHHPQEEPPGFSDTASSPGDSVILSVSPSSTPQVLQLLLHTPGIAPPPPSCNSSSTPFPQHLGSKALLNPSLQALKQRAEDVRLTYSYFISRI